MYKQQMIYYSFLTFCITTICWITVFLISKDVSNHSTQALLYAYLITIIVVYTRFIVFEFRRFKIEYGKIKYIRMGYILGPYWSIENLHVEYRLSVIFKKVYLFQINNGEISINERMFSKKDFKIIEKYIHKHNKIVESKKSFF